MLGNLFIVTVKEQCYLSNNLNLGNQIPELYSLIKLNVSCSQDKTQVFKDTRKENSIFV